MKKFSVFLFTLLALLSIGWSDKASFSLDLVSGKVTHIFEDFSLETGETKTLAKVKLKEAIANNDFALVAIANPNIKTGDYVLLKKIGNYEDFGMGDSFTPVFEFYSIARDQYIFYLFLSFVPLLILVNRKFIGFFVVVLVNALLVFGLVPLFHLWAIPLIFFALFFLLINSYLFSRIFPSKRFSYTLFSSLVAIGIIAYLYERFVAAAKLYEYPLLQQTIVFGTSLPEKNLESLVLIISGFFIFLFTTNQFIRFSFKETIYNNFRIFFFRIFLFYFFLFAGFTLPTINYYQLNHLGTEYLFNNIAFIKTFTKIAFLFWGNFLSCLIYLVSFYIKHKEHFHSDLPRIKMAKGQIPFDFSQAVEDERSSVYNETKLRKKRKITKTKKKSSKKKK